MENQITKMQSDIQELKEQLDVLRGAGYMKLISQGDVSYKERETLKEETRKVLSVINYGEEIIKHQNMAIEFIKENHNEDALNSLKMANINKELFRKEIIKINEADENETDENEFDEYFDDL